MQRLASAKIAVRDERASIADTGQLAERHQPLDAAADDERVDLKHERELA
jgi:hypothetical protein